MNDIKNNQTELSINLFIMMRDHICRELCPGGKYCANMICVESFFKIAGQIENKTEGKEDADKSRPN